MLCPGGLKGMLVGSIPYTFNFRHSIGRCRGCFENVQDDAEPRWEGPDSRSFVRRAFGCKVLPSPTKPAAPPAKQGPQRGRGCRAQSADLPAV
eukprot:3997750-Amphidinium_carterae.3